MVTPKIKTWTVIETVPEDVTKDQFLKAVDIWCNNPRSVNHRVHSSLTLLTAKLKDGSSLDTFVSNAVSCKTDISNFSTDEFHRLLMDLGCGALCSDKCLPIDLTLKKLLPKSSKHFGVSYEISIIDQEAGWGLFVGLPLSQGVSLLPKFPYRLRYDNAKINLELLFDQAISDPSVMWLRSHLLPQLRKWASSHRVHDTAFEKSDTVLPFKSHGLISTEKYAEVYQNLKAKYGQQMVKMWPECTDPTKFVYEDVAIASYILLLWGEEKPISYVELGCGNGLLVHILNSEGHKGVGIDLRSRKIWKMYPETTKLEVCSITPSDSSLFPEADWLIGNHSDELTPWLPVIAARSSQTCKYFLLPCCPYDFDGLKYRRKNSHLSQYADFLMYIKLISEKCGFKTDIDRMRIPSTKRICLVGRDRTYEPDAWMFINASINQMIEDGCRKKAENEENKSNKASNQDNEWVADYKPRDAIEKVRNCTQLEQTLVQEIVMLTVKHLLVKRRLQSHPKYPNKIWNAGGVAAIGDVIALIGTEKLKKLKSECGGLQTLLKNHHQVFLVEKGKVQLRTPILQSDVCNSSKIKIKSKPCWYFENHPDGCLLDEADCAFKHV
ncbi:putative tRNA (uracil-O(2)-)-methyltransferase [Frankliniella fusca]|uniref:tRNA (uracil-O(2)-)-methyltransferase n=1 Tax=Frankliniella fusca TaxID=407009 RepID=A0AAE1LI76_9NEOP|nr:putative tRNA (uracil-O(2)-)-methyltransferase [Frankliniella fusca]